MAGRLHQGSSSNTLVQHSTAETAITRNTTLGSVSMSAAPKEVPQRDDTLATDGPGVLYENPTSRPTTHSPPGQIEEGLTEKSNEAALIQATLPWCRQDGWSGWGRESVSTKSLVPSLVVQALSAGVLDAVTYAEFNTFASNQTGNTILLTVAALGSVEVVLLLTGVSLASFLLGALIFGHLGHFMGIRRRYWILFSSIFQISLLVIAAILLSPVGPASTSPSGRHKWLVLAFFASMSGAQVAQARQSGSQELPTAPMTSSFVDLMADKYLFVSPRHPKAGPRNRRAAYLLAMIAGGFLGAIIHRYAGSWEVVVVTIALKAVVMGLVGIAPADK